MSVLGELLFHNRNRVDLSDALRMRSDEIRKKIAKLPDHVLQVKSDQEIADGFAASEAVKPLSLDFDAAEASVVEVQVEVHDRFGFDSASRRVPGFRATKSIPFSGERDLWKLQTSTYNLNPPRGTVLGDALVIGIDVPAHGSDLAKQYIDDTVASLPQWLSWSRTQVEAFNSGIAASALPYVRERRSHISQASDLLRKLQG